MPHDIDDRHDAAAVVRSVTVAGFPALVGEPPAGVDPKPPVALLHGAFADHEGFAGWVRGLAELGHRTVAASRRGRLGVGPARAAKLSFDDYVADTAAVLDELAEPAILVGHSLGGLIAQRLAARGRARALVLLASAPPSMLTARPPALRRFAPNMPRIMCGRPFIVGNDACSVLALNKVPEAERPAIHAHLTHESGKVYRALMFGTVRVDARRVRVPVWVGGGDEDRIISTRLVRSTAKHYGVEPHIYPGHGHWLLAEPGWDEILADVAAWLSSLPT